MFSAMLGALKQKQVLESASYHGLAAEVAQKASGKKTVEGLLTVQKSGDHHLGCF